MSKILVIDDEPTIRKLLSRMMELEGHEVTQAADRVSALKNAADCRPDIILCDVLLPDGNGIDMIPELKDVSPESAIIMLTAHGNIADGVKAIKNGAFDYITKGDENSKIIPIVGRAVDSLRYKNSGSGKREKASKTPPSGYTFDTIRGHSHCLEKTIQVARKVAQSEVPVLLTGETGTGKEVFAQAIHNGSKRAGKPFVAINCSSFSKELLESEIFGHKAGAFTGAVKDKKGLFEVADHGTIFFDEIGEMAFELQAKLLRVLETGEYIKIGDTQTTRVDVRIISATNRNLKDEIANRHFREDLYFRLSVFQLTLPPLRERREDIEELSKGFISRSETPDTPITPKALAIMKAYDWPGNIRELRNVIERALIVCDGAITPDDLPPEMLSESAEREGDDSGNQYELAAIERRHIERVLKHTGGNKTEAARLLKIGLTTLYRKIGEIN